MHQPLLAGQLQRAEIRQAVVDQDRERADRQQRHHAADGDQTADQEPDRDHRGPGTRGGAHRGESRRQVAAAGHRERHPGETQQEVEEDRGERRARTDRQADTDPAGPRGLPERGAALRRRGKTVRADGADRHPGHREVEQHRRRDRGDDRDRDVSPRVLDLLAQRRDATIAGVGDEQERCRREDSGDAPGGERVEALGRDRGHPVNDEEDQGGKTDQHPSAQASKPWHSQPREFDAFPLFQQSWPQFRVHPCPDTWQQI